MKQCNKLIFSNLWIQRLLRIIVGGIFIYASFDKLIHPDRFAEIVMDYGILPDSLVNISAVWLSFLELLVGLFIIRGKWLRPNSLLLTGLCIIFITAMSYSMLKGEPVHCGCFSTNISQEPRTWSSLWQEGLILIGCIWLWITTFKKNKSEYIQNNL